MLSNIDEECLDGFMNPITAQLLNEIACGIDADSELFRQIEQKLRIADHAIQLARSLENSNIVDSVDRLDVDAILRLCNEKPAQGTHE